MPDLITEIATYIRRRKRAPEERVDLELYRLRLCAEVDRRWPAATNAQFEQAARLAIVQIKDDAETLLAQAALWNACSPRDRGSG